METPTAAAVLALALLALNIAVTRAVARSGYYSRAQKAAQALIVWLIPVLGAVAVGVILYSQKDNPVYDTRAYPDRDEKTDVVQAFRDHD